MAKPTRFIPKGHFPFISLPAELRNAVYELTLPQNLTFKFSRYAKEKEDTESEWQVKARPSDSPSQNDYVLVVERGTRLDEDCPGYDVRGKPGSGSNPQRKRGNSIITSELESLRRLGVSGDGLGLGLLGMSKAVNAEARSIFFANNEFIFRIPAHSRHSDLPGSAIIFGPLGLQHRMHFVRKMKHILLVLDVDNAGVWTMKRLRALLARFVECIIQDTDNVTRNSLSKKLHVRFVWNGFSHDWYAGQYVFALEALTPLRRIKDISIKDTHITDINPRFTQCMELCIKGEGGDLNERERIVRYVKRRHFVDGPMVKKPIYSRHWADPLLDWREFAKRNEIEVPADWLESSDM